MRNVYARCMDGHFYLVNDSAHCPIDGSPADAATAVIESGDIRADVTLGTLLEAGVAARLLVDVMIVERPDGSDVAEVLQPR